MLTKILSGHGVRRTRLHDEKGNFVGWKKLTMHGPPAILTGLLRLVLNYRPEVPWISYAAIGILEKFLSKESRVLEFGSGMSTIWYAKHAGIVFSVEHDSNWYSKIKLISEERKITNINYKLSQKQIEYESYMSSDNLGFDLIMIDGAYRSGCMSNAVKLLRPGGIIYLDNSDKDSSSQGGDIRIAEQLALSFARDRKGKVEYFTDFAPTQLFVQEGLMIKTP